MGLKDPDEDLSNDGMGLNSSVTSDIGSGIPGVEAQLLITLSNCAYMRRVILPRLKESLVRAGYPENQVFYLRNKHVLVFINEK